MKLIRPLVLLVALALPACAALGGILPDIVMYVTDGTSIIDAIASFVNAYFLQHPDPPAQANVEVALVKTRSALTTLLRSAQGAQAMTDANVDAAFNDFKAAYLELLALTAPFGVTPNGVGKMSASPGKLLVPQPLAFRTKGGR